MNTQNTNTATPATFKAWLQETLDADQIRDLANHGADSGFPGLTYTNGMRETFKTYGEEIWDKAVDEAEQMGCKNVAEMIAGFGRADMLESLGGFEALMVWYMAETVAREIDDADDDSESGTEDDSDVE